MHADIDEARKALGISTDHYEDLTQEDPEWEKRLQHVANFKPGEHQESFADFRLRCFGYQTPHHHARMVRAIDATKVDELTAILCFPASGKTTLLTDWYCWKLATNPNYRIAVISEGQDLARKIVGLVAARMSDPFVSAEYLRTFGPFRAPDRTKPWNADFLQVLRAVRSEKEPSLEARGAGSTLYGGRYDAIILDDIQSDRNLNATAQLLTYIRQTVITRPDEDDSKVVFVGSRVGPNDIYHRMLEEEVITNLAKIPALQPQDLPREKHFTVRKVKGRNEIEVNPDCGAVPTWPERWSMQKLAVRRWIVKEEVWARTYQQMQVASGFAAYNEHVVDSARDYKRLAGPSSVGTENAISIDPALDKGVCAFMAAASTSERLYLLDCDARPGYASNEEILRTLETWARTYRPTTVIVEQNSYQKSLVRDDRMNSLAQKFGFTIVPHVTNRNKHDPVMGVAQMAPGFVDGEVSIPWGDDVTKAKFGRLCDQLLMWTPTKSGVQLEQDLVMVLWFLWMWWESNRHSGSNITHLWRPSWMRSA